MSKAVSMNLSTRKPVLFYDLKLPHKLPPIANPITLKSLPLPGFLEQTLGIALCRALSAVGQDRPKFPFIKIKRSALIYMGLHLKAKSMPLPYYPVAKRSSEFNKKLDDFLNCEECVDQPETWIEWDK
ncbi:unnamed protein product [Trichobilharzia regenti]|nr:unnamed protein product [Trichobilharzia regenti]